MRVAGMMWRLVLNVGDEFGHASDRTLMVVAPHFNAAVELAERERTHIKESSKCWSTIVGLEHVMYSAVLTEDAKCE